MMMMRYGALSCFEIETHHHHHYLSSTSAAAAAVPVVAVIGGWVGLDEGDTVGPKLRSEKEDR